MKLKMIYKPKNVKIFLIILLMGGSFFFLLSPVSVIGYDEATMDSNQDALFGFDDLLPEPENADLETPEFSKISITFLEFASYVEEETMEDPIITSLVMFQKFAEFEINEEISSESFETYRENAELSGNSLVGDPQGSNNELVIPLIRMEADKTGNRLPRIEVDIPKSVFRALENSSFIRAIDDVNSIPFQFCSDSLDWGVDYIDAEKIWNGTENAVDVDPNKPSGVGIKVAILDSGIDTNHEDLDFDEDNGRNFVDENDNVTDTNGHGTHVTGIVAAQDNGFGLIGVAPNVTLYIGKIGASTIMIANIVSGIEWAIDEEVDIISMSFGTTGNYSTLHSVCGEAFNAGIILVAAADKEGTTAAHYPSSYDIVIGVGAIYPNGSKWEFSNYGVGVDTYAPGVEINSTMPQYPCYLNNNSIRNHTEDYDVSTGTSVATPMVTGICALILSSQPSRTFSPPGLIELIRLSQNDSGTWDILDGDAAVELADECYFASDYLTGFAQVNIQPYVIYGTDAYEDFGIYTKWAFSDNLNGDDYLHVKLYSRAYIRRHGINLRTLEESNIRYWAATPYNMVQWTSSYLDNPSVTTWDFSTGGTTYKMPYGNDITSNPTISTGQYQSTVNSWRYMGYLETYDVGEFDALLKLQVDNDKTEDYNTGHWVYSWSYEYTYYIEKMEFRIEIDWWWDMPYVGWTQMAMLHSTFGDGGDYDVSSLTLEPGTSPD